jgi:hypothetical protein
MMFGYWGGGLKLRGFVHMLKWDCACVHAQLEACTFSTGSVCMHNRKCAHAQLERVHAEVCTCLPESVRMLKWKRAHAQL